MNRAGELRHRVTVFTPHTAFDDIGMAGNEYEVLRTIWAKIVPASGRNETLDGDVERMEVTHRVFIRTAALPELSPDMYLTYRGQRYDIQYFMPVYNQRGWTEIGCTMVVEKYGL